MPRLPAIAFALACACAPAARAEDAPYAPRGVWFQPYEPSTLGETFDSDDVAFTDITLSLKYPILPMKMQQWWGPQDKVFLAFTGRFGFYWGGRESSPVIGKRFNPKLLWQHAFTWHISEGDGFIPRLSITPFGDAKAEPANTIELGYAHESNGQPINTLEQFRNAQASALETDHNAEFARDYISRGWDYIGLNTKMSAIDSEARGQLAGYLRLRYFLPYGVFQGKAEEVRDWEGVADAKHRRAVNGIEWMAKYQWHAHPQADSVLGDMKVAAGIETGYDPLFRYGTVRVEAGMQVWQLPVTVWWRSGYGSDLAQYYRKVTSWGVELDIGSF